MTTTTRDQLKDVDGSSVGVVTDEDIVKSSVARKALAALRIGFGVTFLWAFLDKLLALGYATGTDPETGAVDRFGDAAWINGGSPTEGFMKFGVSESNWFHGIFSSLGGTLFADVLFMAGLLGIGLALTLGFGIRIAGITGALLYFLMWVATFPLENNPLVDDHLLGMITVIVLALTLSGDTWGVGKAWAKTRLVRRMSILR